MNFEGQFVHSYLCFAFSGLAAAENILNTMRAAQLNISNDTKLSILKGILRYSNVRDFDRAVEMYGFKLNEYQLLDIVNELNFNNIIFLSKVINMHIQVLILFVNFMFSCHFRLKISMINLHFQKNSETILSKNVLALFT